jgi:hypothetical protein
VSTAIAGFENHEENLAATASLLNLDAATTAFATAAITP